MMNEEAAPRPLPARPRSPREPVCCGLALGFGGGMLGDLLLGETPSWLAQVGLEGVVLALGSLAAFSLGYLATASRQARAGARRARYDEGEIA